MIDFLVFGAGGQAKVIHDAAVKEGKHRVCGYVVDHHDQGPGARFLDAPLYRLEEILKLRSHLTKNFMVAIGDNAVRQAKTRLMESFGFQPISLVHPFSSVGHDVKIGAGVLICAAAVIDPGVVIGDGAIVNAGAAVGHESRIGKFTHISGASFIGANCVIDDLTFVAMRATVISGKSVGRNSFIGAGALVTKEVPADVSALGSPARYRSRGVVLSAEAPLAAMMAMPQTSS
jgi:sugar O-acyltransferase (sialic acid O-acetyltransferase NeuD family)